MTTDVRAPNGDIVKFPDGMSDEKISAAMRAAYGSKGKPGYLDDAVKSAGAGLAAGAAGLVGLPGTVAEFGAQGIDAATRFVGGKLGIAPAPPRAEKGKRETLTGFELPDIPTVTRAMEDNITGPLHEPTTTPGNYIKTAAEFVPGAVAGPGGVLGNLMKFGLIPGVASEAAGQATKGSTMEGPARVGAALLGGGAAGLATRPSRTSQIIRGQMPEGVTPQMVDQAEGLIVDAAQQGVALAWPEALSQVAGRPVLTNTMRHLEGAPSSEARMGEFFGQRPQQVDRAAGQAFDTVTPAAPNPSTIGPAVGTAAEGTINDVRGAINRASDPFYTAAESVRLTPREIRQVHALPGYAEARNAVRNNPQLNRYVSHLPDDSVGFLNEVKKYLDTAGQNARAPVNAQRNTQVAAGFEQDAATARRTGIGASRDYETALAIQTQGREQFLQPLLDGPLGKIASSDTTTKKAIDALFPTNPLPNSANEIATAVSALAARNPYAARQLVRAHMEMTFNETSQALQSGANQAGGAKFRAVVVGNPQQAANLEAAVRALPNGDQIWPGINRFLDVLEATGTRQNIGSKTAYNAEFLKQQGTSGLVGESVKAASNPLRGVQFLADKYEKFRLGENLDNLAHVFTDPRAGNLFRSIARMPIDSGGAAKVAWRIALLIDAAALPGTEPAKKTGE